MAATQPNRLSSLSMECDPAPSSASSLCNFHDEGTVIGSETSSIRSVNRHHQHQLNRHSAHLSHSSPATKIHTDEGRPDSHPPLLTPRRSTYAVNQTPRLSPLTDPHPESEEGELQALPSVLLRDGSPRRLGPKPRASLTRLSSLDALLEFREEKAEWKRASANLGGGRQCYSEGDMRATYLQRPSPLAQLHSVGDYADGGGAGGCEKGETVKVPETRGSIVFEAGADAKAKDDSKFRNLPSEYGFCLTIALTQFLAEYLISGFAIELPKLLYDRLDVGPGSLGLFWPASLLSLILSATLLVFARLSDIYGGYMPFMFGVAWMAIWTLLPGFFKGPIVLDVARAMQGLAIAAYMPSTFTMIGTFFDEGPRRNFVLGLYSGCAPLGFFAGFLTAGALPDDKPEWYFWIASAIAFVTLITAYTAIPKDKTDRGKLELEMDWLGAFFITAGLILVSYALAVEAYANQFDPVRNGFTYAIVYGPFASGLVCLALAFVVEGWVAKCPLLPFDFFKPKGVIAFSLAGLCFYASYGVWLYNSADYFQSPTGVTKSPNGIGGIWLAVWYVPTAALGVILCLVGGRLLHYVPIMALLLASGVAWIGAPLFLALSPRPLNYWSAVLPSMFCATVGIDVTFTVSIVFFSSVQPLRYQGLCGAVCSILVNLAMSFSLSISEIVVKKARNTVLNAAGYNSTGLSPADNLAIFAHATNVSYRAAFFYATASAGLGLAICVLFVRISRSVVGGAQQPADDDDGESQGRTSSSASTLFVDDERDEAGGTLGAG